jgi:hypothetical protein
MKEGLILALAIIIPGGLIVYFMWKGWKLRAKRRIKKQREELLAKAIEEFKAQYPTEGDQHAQNTKRNNGKTRNLRKFGKHNQIKIH